jgi:hypothetical protein
MLPLFILFLSACAQDVSIIKNMEESEECESTVWYLDADADGFGGSDAIASCTSVEGYVENNNDCDDSNATVYPDAPELCNNVDDDCDTVIDNDLGDPQEWYLDADGDGFGDENAMITDCDMPEGYIDNAEDCNDNDILIHPNSEEVCDELDNDCDGIIDNDLGDEFYQDADSDGYGTTENTLTACDQPDGYVNNADDCDDTDDGLTLSCDPPVVTESICSGTPYTAIGNNTSQPELHILSAYESSHNGTVSVHIDRPTQMTVVLSSYEPVLWVVTTGPNTQVDKILLNGYHSQTISLNSSIPFETRSYDQTVSNFGYWCGYALPYNGGGCDTNQLLNGVTSYTGLDWTSFNGCYSASQFLLE